MSSAGTGRLNNPPSRRSRCGAELELRLRFHALGDGLDAERVRHGDDRLHDRGAIRVAGAIVHERLVDLSTLMEKREVTQAQ